MLQEVVHLLKPFKKSSDGNIPYTVLFPPSSAQGRSVRIPRAVKGGRVGMMTFNELCGSALGAADYTAISEAFHTIFVDGVPMMNLVHLNQARPPPPPRDIATCSFHKFYSRIAHVQHTGRGAAL